MNDKNMKIAFTLAEILIVLTIIGVMAVMTIPSLIQNANSQHKIAMFKKGFNALSNAYATEFATKTPPKNTNDGEKLWKALNNNLNVKYYANAANGTKYYNIAEIEAVSLTSRVIVTEDGIAYRLGNIQSKDCQPKLIVNSYLNSGDTGSYAACLDVAIILDKKYVYSDSQPCHSTNDGDKQDLTKLKCNTLWIYVAKEGFTSGNPDCTIPGRILSNNITYDTSKCTESP